MDATTSRYLRIVDDQISPEGLATLLTGRGKLHDPDNARYGKRDSAGAADVLTFTLRTSDPAERTSIS